VLPEWARGAVLLVPMTAEQVAEGGLELRFHNVVALESDKERLAEALRDVPRKRRPQVKADHQADAAGAERTGPGACWEGAGPNSGSAQRGGGEGDAPRRVAELLEELGVVEERTFLHCPAAALNFELSEASGPVQTEPPSGAGGPAHAKPRRWTRRRRAR